MPRLKQMAPPPQKHLQVGVGRPGRGGPDMGRADPRWSGVGSPAGPTHSASLISTRCKNPGAVRCQPFQIVSAYQRTAPRLRKRRCTPIIHYSGAVFSQKITCRLSSWASSQQGCCPIVTSTFQRILFTFSVQKSRRYVLQSSHALCQLARCPLGGSIRFPWSTVMLDNMNTP
jgi:hypothetical protein